MVLLALALAFRMIDADYPYAHGLAFDAQVRALYLWVVRMYLLDYDSCFCA